MYKIVVVGTDGSSTADQAVRAAADIARSWGSKLHVVTAVRAPRPGMASATGAPLIDSGAGQALVQEAAKAVGETARVSVRDDGPGVSPEVRARLFEPGVSTKPGGGGLGLALARRIVEQQHGGRVLYRPGSTGSEFVLEFPMVTTS